MSMWGQSTGRVFLGALYSWYSPSFGDDPFTDEADPTPDTASLAGEIRLDLADRTSGGEGELYNPGTLRRVAGSARPFRAARAAFLRRKLRRGGRAILSTLNGDIGPF